MLPGRFAVGQPCALLSCTPLCRLSICSDAEATGGVKAKRRSEASHWSPVLGEVPGSFHRCQQLQL